MSRSDAVVIGGGFYGLRIALQLRTHLRLKRVTVLEADSAVMNRASFVNQARVHNGYHYPRSLLTGRRSNTNMPRFRAEYRDAVVEHYRHYYAIARTLSKTNARQFELFCRRIGSTVVNAPVEVATAFDSARIEKVFEVEEPAFDSRTLRALLLERIEEVGGIDIELEAEVRHVGGRAHDLEATTSRGTHRAPLVISAVYSGLNLLHEASGLPLLDLQHEVAEMALVALPDRLAGSAFTVMDGPFFSMMPFPSRGLHTLSHVRYTPHRRWRESTATVTDPYAAVRAARDRSQFAGMYADVLRYLPSATGMQYRDSLYEAKTVLARTSNDDSRPILFRADHGVPGYVCVLGGKLDNIYDVFEELERYGR